MKPTEKHDNLFSDDNSPRPRKSGLRTLDDLEDEAIPTLSTAFNTCTRAGDRRQLEDRRGRTRPNCEQRRSGRDRRMMTYY